VRGKKLFPSTLLLWGKRIMLLSLMSAAMWGCSKEPQQTIHWHNAYDIERELHLLGQQEDPREIYKRLQGIKQQASLHSFLKCVKQVIRTRYLGNGWSRYALAYR
tara:strand:- start:1086 stop:1400 length:315 start_codon:yes stop_codon:yes gene_type:complete